jgi:hypothetical protein
MDIKDNRDGDQPVAVDACDIAIRLNRNLYFKTNLKFSVSEVNLEMERRRTG